MLIRVASLPSYSSASSTCLLTAPTSGRTLPLGTQRPILWQCQYVGSHI